ncbi:hypothetical protein SAY86_018808 [Trapa natans]|uniref:Homeobox prospero protein n=1 Tax=Trapa natans TaxID=22666 RepID=A0AAN7LFP7_TRANT|nr:hypothetical protein SAY86_018808 [Trapa natans]
MARKTFQQAKTGIEYLKSLNSEKNLRKIGMGRDDRYFWKQIGKALLCTYSIMGAAWVYNETSPLGWFNIQIKPKEEKELAHLYERREFPYPGDEAAMEEFIAKGGMIGTAISPKGSTEPDAYNYQKDLENRKFEQEAQKLWFRMRNEVVQELQEKGYDVE